ncbi:MAG: hypothetical protein HKN50_10705 [Gammaproteobacteria bacterium]|nr:hypothetical protein [Gammaproteobacteria bacterium]
MRKLPVILIPGIQGTTLMDTNRHDFKSVWSGIKKFFSNIHQLRLKIDGTSDEHLEAIIERADVEDLAYSELINYLKDRGYKVFIFGYDWRKSTAESAIKLAALVESLKKRYRNTGSFNFITHSMGGLVLSAYLKSLDKAERNKVVNRAIITVPPFLGSMEATMSLTMGSSLLFNSSEDFRKVARTFPAIYELLPVYDGAYKFDNANDAANYDPFNFDSYWQQVKRVNRDDTKAKHELMRTRLQRLGKLRDQSNLVFDFRNESKAFCKKFVVVSGVGSDTRQVTGIKQGHKHYKYFFEFEKRSKNDGDGTVPAPSTHVFKDHITTISVEKSLFEAWMDSRIVGRADHHAFFLNNGRVQNIITRFLEGKTKRRNWYESAGSGVEKVV